AVGGGARAELASRFHVASASNLSVEAISTLPLVLREPGSGTRAVALQALEAAGVDVDRLDIVLEIGGNAAAREATLTGIGASFLSRLAVHDEVSSGRLVSLRFLETPLLRPLVLVTRAGRTLSPGAMELIRALTGPK